MNDEFFANSDEDEAWKISRDVEWYKISSEYTNVFWSILSPSVAIS
jgi:hypothetical protein